MVQRLDYNPDNQIALDLGQGQQKTGRSRFLHWLAEWTGLEPATPGVTGRYSNQLNYHSAENLGVPTGIRTPVTAVKGRCPRPLDDGDPDKNYSSFTSRGGGKRDRTADLLHAMQALSQLSYTPGAVKERALYGLDTSL
jgi:hypothetical protein